MPNPTDSSHPSALQHVQPAAPATPDAPVRISGWAWTMLAFDIGFQVDLDKAEPWVREATRRRVVRARRPAPVWFDYSPPPLMLVLSGSEIPVLDGEPALTTDASVELLLYDFGAALLTYKTPLPATLDRLPDLACALHDNTGLEADARAHLTRIMEAIGGAIERPNLSDAVEDYTAFSIEQWPEDASPEQLARDFRTDLAMALEAERQPVSDQQAERTLGGRIAYTDNDLAIIDWNAAVLFDREPQDVIAVLQHANVELLELRVLDQELDAILDHADETLNAIVKRRIWPGFATGRILGRVAAAHTDAAVMFEGVNNAIKLLGNQYLARLYRVAAGRLDLPAWHGSVHRKLEAVDNLYDKMEGVAGTRRLETLEWVIILLILISIILPFTPIY
ncbi:MAG: hypothetical protein RIE77_04385 [Phycisphaerales bacterium]